MNIDLDGGTKSNSRPLGGTGQIPVPLSYSDTHIHWRDVHDQSMYTLKPRVAVIDDLAYDVDKAIFIADFPPG